MFIPEINEIKQQLDALKDEGFITDWQLPYENLLTRRTAAIFFLTPAGNAAEEEIWSRFEPYDHFSRRQNTERKLSDLEYRLTFSKEEKEKNQII
jgi:hypothetical protein